MTEAERGAPTAAPQRPSLIGRSMPRKEDRPLLTGSAAFADDLHRPGALHAAIVRSPLAHAAIRRIDAGPALAVEGVELVLTAADLPAGGVRIPIRLFAQPGLERYLQSPLAEGVVRYAGEPVAMIVAASRYLAEDAAELVEIDYEPLEVVLDPTIAVKEDAPAIHAQTGSNVAGTLTIADDGVDAALAAADLVIEEQLRSQRHAAVPLETRGLLAELDEATGELTVWGAAKLPHVNQRILARMLGWPEQRLRLIELAVGGGFGARGEVYPEDYLVPLAAVRLGRPIKWSEDRQEHLVSTNHSREQVHEVTLALRSDGTFLALCDSFVNNTGAYVRTHGMVVPGMTAGLMPGPYDWGCYRAELRHVVTNKTPAGTYRAPGRYEANFARERVIDIAAHRLGIDPVELRRRNLIQPEQIPYVSRSHTDGHPVVFDSGDYPLLLDRSCERFGYEAALRWRSEPAEAGRARGVGISYFTEKAGIGSFEYARAEVTAAGRIAVHTGIASVGQGVETILAQICAERLGVEYDRVGVFHGDTSTTPDGLGAFGSRATMLAGSALAEASDRLRARILEHAAAELEADEGDLDIRRGQIVVVGAPDRTVSLETLRERARPVTALPRGLEPGLSEEAWFHCPDMSFPYGVHLAAVEVDLETGAGRDRALHGRLRHRPHGQPDAGGRPDRRGRSAGRRRRPARGARLRRRRQPRLGLVHGLPPPDGSGGARGGRARHRGCANAAEPARREGGGRGRNGRSWSHDRKRRLGCARG